MSEPLELTGIPASAGYAEGPWFDLDRPSSRYAAKDSPRAEAEALREALAAATLRLGRLIADLSGEAREVLEFQFAMIEDEALTAPALLSIGEGVTADAAWRAALDAEIAGYVNSQEEYFKARASDLIDIRDQVLRELASEAAIAVPAGAILYGDDIAPTRFLETDWSGGGIALKGGSSASHVAMLARSRGVPMVVGLGAPASVPSGFALLDAEHGEIVFAPSEVDLSRFRRNRAAFSARRDQAQSFLTRPAVTKDGTPVRVRVNVADPVETEAFDIANCDGVGLMRTEFLFGGKTGLPDEETQYRAYRKVLEWAGGKPVTIRTVDAGGDKPVPGFTVEESNPFLGQRGIRLSLARPEIFRIQIRALLRAAVHGALKVMFPMVSVPDEYHQAAALFAEEAARLAAEGVDHKSPPLGIMVEVPSVAIAPELFSDVAFFSIGSNDLTQYVMAAARDNGTVARLNDVTNPSVLRLIGQIVTYGHEQGIPVSFCGDAGGNPAAIPDLLRAGLRDLSMAPAQLAAGKAAIADVSV